LRQLPRQTDSNVLVGFETSDDAGVYLLDENSALVQTVDFFTPIVDDPRMFGEIATTNSLSDIYAMGGRPISALSIVGFPEKGDSQILAEILQGGLAKMIEAKCTVIGGHSIRNEDVLFGYAVTGLIHPKKVWRNVGARTGDALLFTKPLGTGVISTAIKKEQASAESIAAAIRSMTALNRAAAGALHEIETQPQWENSIHAVTDVTGFGLLGHAREMALGNPEKGIPPTSFKLDHTAFAYLPGAIDAAKDGYIPGGLKNNRDFIGDCVEFSPTVSQEYRDLLFDPQTAGGLLISIAAEAASDALSALQRVGVAASRIGAVVQKRSPLLHVK
jgi:selenide, water dikinase